MSRSLPRHRRAAVPPPFRLTPRDVAVVEAVHAYRILRRDQVQALFFPSRNTANERLKRLYHGGYLERRWLPVAYGQGSSQALYLLASGGARLVAQHRGLDVADLDWRRSRNAVSSPFLEHALMVNDVRIAVERAARAEGYEVEEWRSEDALKRHPDRVTLKRKGGKRRSVALVPDAYFALRRGARRSRFFLECDRATETHGRWRQKVAAYLAYVRSGAYARRYGSNCLRVLTVTTGERRMANLLRTTQESAARPESARLFWFTCAEQVQAASVLSTPIWRVAGHDGVSPLLVAEKAEGTASPPRAQLLFRA